MKLTKIIPVFIVFLFCILGVLFKISVYPDPSLSFSTMDTENYIEASKIPISLDFFTSNRPATIGFFYKLLKPSNGYQVPEPISAEKNSKNPLADLPGFDRITFTQFLISTVAWSFLALTVTLYLRNSVIKIVGGGMIVLFSIVPQISDWNYIIQSESLSFSFFAFTFAFTFHWVFYLLDHPNPKDKRSIVLTILFLLSLVFWVFSRDSNAYFLIGLFVMLILPIFIVPLRNRLPIKIILPTALSVFVLFVFQNYTFNKSDRWVNPIMNNIKVQILPYEKRVQIFESYGMPYDDEINTYAFATWDKRYYDNEAMITWLKKEGLRDYKKFLISTPFHTIFYPLEILSYSFSDNLQPYFINKTIPKSLSGVGNFLNPNYPEILFFDLVFLVILFMKLIQHPDSFSGPTTWIVTLFFTSTILMYYATIHGDSQSTTRHALVSVMPWRLFFWMMLTIIVDIEIQNTIGGLAKWKDRVVKN